MSNTKFTVEWEAVALLTDRLPVPGGWLYRCRAGYLSDPTMVFVPLYSEDEYEDVERLEDK